jgi:hypothetical protein
MNIDAGYRPNLSRTSDLIGSASIVANAASVREAVDAERTLDTVAAVLVVGMNDTTVPVPHDVLDLVSAGGHLP